MSYAEANYGALTPQDVASDRFGLRQDTEIFHTRPARLETVVSTIWDAPVRRLGLMLEKWRYSRYHGHSDYNLSVHGRPLVITHRRDGRVSIWFDGKTIYEQVKLKRRGEYEVVERIDDRVEQARRVAEHEAKMDAVRERLERASANRRA